MLDKSTGRSMALVKGSAPATAAASAPKTAGETILGKMAANFRRLFSEAAESSPASADGSRPVMGPYNMPIFYLSDGTIIHSCAHPIGDLKSKRAKTVNAIEMTCPALALAIYVSTQVQLNPGPGAGGRGGFKAVRMVVYDFRNLHPTEELTATSPEELLAGLHSILVRTYNRLGREYNLAGFLSDWLCLSSSRPDMIPHIPLNLDTYHA